MESEEARTSHGTGEKDDSKNPTVTSAEETKQHVFLHSAIYERRLQLGMGVGVTGRGGCGGRDAEPNHLT